MGTNRYGYADNDPVNKSDANGHVGNVVGGALVGLAVDIAIKGVAVALGMQESISIDQAMSAAAIGAMTSGLSAGVAIGMAAANTSIRGNRALGKAAEAMIGKQLGAAVVGSQVGVNATVRSSNRAMRSVMDHVVQRKGNLVAIDVKVGRAVLSKNQKAAQAAAPRGQAAIARNSRNVPAQLRGQPISAVEAVTRSRARAAGHMVGPINSARAAQAAVVTGVVSTAETATNASANQSPSPGDTDSSSSGAAAP